MQLISLGIKVPQEYKLAAQYTLSYDFNELFKEPKHISDEYIIQQAQEIVEEANIFNIKLDKKPASLIFSSEIQNLIYNFTKKFEISRLEKIIKIFETASKLKVPVDIAEAQNMYFNKIYTNFTKLLDAALAEHSDTDKVRDFLFSILVLGEHLNINTEFYKSSILRLTSERIQIPN